MKKFITPPYIFSPGSPGIGYVELTIESFDIKKLIAINNVTRGVIIYLPTSPTIGLHSLIDTRVVLKLDTSTHDSEDVLQVIYEDDTDTLNQEDNFKAVLLFLATISEKFARLDINDRATVNVETGTIGVSSLPTLSTVTNLTNINNFAGGNAAPLPYHVSNIGALHIYNQIEFS